CGFKLFRREAFLRIFDKVHSNEFAFDSEVVIKALLLGYRVKEVPINWRHVDGSKIKVIDQVLSMGKGLLSIWHDVYIFQQQNQVISASYDGLICDNGTNKSRGLCRGEFFLKVGELLNLREHAKK
ncbi:MAG: hypothetical protein ACRD4W_10445, partial [Nitrososphaeraceae archaeon]